MNDEQIVLVDVLGNPIGVAPKLASHHEDTPLHLAFSVYIFNQDNQVLVTQRANAKKVWPGVWTNSCCGHPLPGEPTTAAISRRVSYELGMKISNLLCVLPDYRYKTPAFRGVVENEFCPVFFARSHDTPSANPLEVEGFEWVSWERFVQEAAGDTKRGWSWWCKDQIKRLPKDAVTKFLQSSTTSDSASPTHE